MSQKYLEFTERMAGNFFQKSFLLNPNEPLSRQDFLNTAGVSLGESFEFLLTIKVSDVENFIKDPNLTAQAVGKITNPFEKKGPDFQVEKGTFNLFIRPSANPDLNTAKEMHYLLYFTDTKGQPWTFFGYKEIIKEDGFEAWEQTTTLYYYIWKGHSSLTDAGTKEVYGLGILHISVADFIKQLGTFKTSGQNKIEDIEITGEFLGAFASNLWQAYAPYIFTTTSARWNEHLLPVNTTQGVALGEKTLYPFDTDDGLTLSLQRFKVKESKNIVLLIHGLTTSTDMFIMPEHKNIVNQLHAAGFTDVWSLDWRGSGRFIYNLAPHRFTIDDVAKYDIPKALEFIREKCGKDVQINIICHCVGSLAFMASLAAGYVSGIQSIVSNSVSFTPKVRWQGFLKVLFGPELLEYVFRYPYVSPRLAYMPGPGFGKWLYWMERTIRHECTEPACHLVSFMWGWGFPSAYKHRNIHPITHRRLVDLFGGTSFHYYRHIRKMLFKGASVSYNSDNEINYLDEIKKRTLPPTLLMSGAENNIFPGSNKKTYEALQNSQHSEKVQYVEFPEYGHQDVLMGQYCHIEVFPKIISFLKQQNKI
ncbi:MAG: alpha/beta fold hydrolase [Pseudobdellovibrionaceae bacterium]